MAVSSPPFVPGQGHPFHLESVLGRGASATVWRATDPVYGRVAVKLLDPTIAVDTLATLRREHDALAAVRHPNVVRVHALHERPRPALVMELVEGESLLVALGGPGAAGQTGRWRTGRLLDLLLQLLDGLRAIHECGIVHRDVKPANVLVTASGAVKLLDVGLATPEATAGTLRYMAPEVLLGEPASVRSDLYAVGAMAYEAVVGDVPFGSERPSDAFAAARINRDPPPPHALAPAVAREISDAVLLLVQRDPAARPATAAEAARLLAEAAAASGVQTPAGSVGTLAVTDPGPVGRTTLLAEISARVAHAQTRCESASLLVHGPAGSGKGRALAGILLALDPSVVVLHADGRGETRPLAAFAPALEELVFAFAAIDNARAAALLPRSARALERLTPLVRDLPGFDWLPRLVDLDDAAADARAADALCDLIGNSAGERRVVLTAEAVGEMTQASRRVVARLSREAPRPFVLLATSLGPLDDRAIGRTAVVALGPLTRLQLGELALRALGHPASAALLDWLATASESHPERAVEALRSAVAVGALALRNAEVAFDRDVGANLVLEADRALIRDLGAKSLLLAAAHAVLGGPATNAQAAVLSRLRPSAAATARAELIRRGALRERRGRDDLRSPGFARAVLETLQETSRRAIERRAARAAEAGDDVAAAAGHWVKAGEAGRAAPLLANAARRALARQEAEDAHAFATLGLRTMEGKARSRDRQSEFLLLRSRAAALLGRSADASRDFEEASDILAGRALEGAALLDFVDAETSHFRAQGEIDRSLPRLERHLARAETQGDEHTAAFIRDRLATLLNDAGNRADAERHIHLAIAFFLRTRDHVSLTRMVNLLGAVLSHRGEVDLALATFRRALRLARGAGLRRLEALILKNQGAVLELRWENHRALANLEEALKVARAIGDRGMEGETLHAMALNLAHLGQYQHALETLRDAETALIPAVRRRSLALLELLRGDVLARIGDPEASVRHLDHAEELLRSCAPGYLPKVLFTRAEVLLARGDREAAHAAIASAREAGSRHGLDWTEAEAESLLAMLALVDGFADEAEHHARAALPDLERRRDLPVLSRVHRVLAVAGDDLALADRAVDLAVEASDPEAELQARVARLRILERRGEVAEASAERARGVELVERIAARSGPHRQAFLNRPEPRLLRADIDA